MPAPPVTLASAVHSRLSCTSPASAAATLNAELGTGFAGHQDLDLAIVVDRRRQRRAILAHASQAVPGSALWRRLELSGTVDHCRWLGAAPIRSSAR